MDDVLSRSILITEIALLLKTLEDRGTSFLAVPHSDEDLNKLGLADLRLIKSDLRDLLRTLGGTRV